jgi:hypothetical protein
LKKAPFSDQGQRSIFRLRECVQSIFRIEKPLVAIFCNDFPYLKSIVMGHFDAKIYGE